MSHPLYKVSNCQNVVKALKRLESFTRGRFDIWMLAGKHLSASRAIVLSDLYGTRVTQASAGVTALREAFYTALEVTGDCLAAKEEDFIRLAKATLRESAQQETEASNG